MKVTMIPIVVCALGIIPKGLIKGLEDLEIRGQVETNQTIALSRSAWVLRGVRETCCHSNSCHSNAGEKNSKRSKIIIYKLEQIENKIRHNWLGKVIHRELCQKLKFDPTTKWFIHKSESLPENRRIKYSRILRYKRTPDPCQRTRPGDNSGKKSKKQKENLPFSGFCRPSRSSCENQRKQQQKEKYLDLARELRKLWDMRVTVIPFVIGALGTVHKSLEKGLEELEDCSEYSEESRKSEETCCHS